ELSQTGGTNAGKGLHFLQQILINAVESLVSSRDVSLVASLGLDTHNQHVVAGGFRFLAPEVLKAAHEQARSDQQQQRERNLDDRQDPARLKATAARSLGAAQMF